MVWLNSLKTCGVFRGHLPSVAFQEKDMNSNQNYEIIKKKLKQVKYQGAGF